MISKKIQSIEKIIEEGNIMDFIDQLKQFALRVERMQPQIVTEEATKTSLILPFFQLLGYDIFDPGEFTPEYTADFGVKKGEKVDYAILQDGQPIILIEAKWCGDKLDKHGSQLFRYFSTTPAKFGILTNGIVYQFFTDLEEANKMDDRPFMEINLLDIKESLVPELKKFHKTALDVDSVFTTASELKYSQLIKGLFVRQMQDTSDCFVSYVLGEIYEGRKTKQTIDKFRDIVKRSFNQFLNETMNERIKAAIGQAEKGVNVDQDAASNENLSDALDEKSRITTTLEELEYFYTIKSLLRGAIASERVFYRDTEAYLGILIDDNKNKWICRLYLNGAQKNIVLFDKDKNHSRIAIDSIDDVYDLQSQLIDIATLRAM